MLHLAQIWVELLLFDQSWFSLWECIQIFPIYGKISYFTQIWMKMSQFFQISLRLLNVHKWFEIYPNTNKALIVNPGISKYTVELV